MRSNLSGRAAVTPVLPARPTLTDRFQKKAISNSSLAVGLSVGQRLVGHRKAQKQYLAGKGHWCSSFEILAFGDAYIELVRVVEFEVKAELLAVEGELLIRTNECVNKRQEGRTDAQYYIDNRAKILEYRATYDAAHVEENRQAEWRSFRTEFVDRAILPRDLEVPYFHYQRAGPTCAR